ncbi:MAG: NADPH:quinone oxidoreductase family protein [Candidatus Nanopelagicaceae bacterium]|nr:NADPH:quinone oxidoreductase family protein [Candidatus Nanopelagicaceae bacterium]
MKAIRVERFGGPEVMEYVDLADPVPSVDQEFISVTSIGVNYADTHQIENSYRVPQRLPLLPGLEVVGTTASGKRVLAAVSGGYAQKAVADKAQCVEIPDGVSDEQALAMLVQGTTAWHILKTVGHIKPGESVVIHAAAGGVGTVSIQLAKMWGGKVIAVTSAGEKADLAKSLGADKWVDANSEDLGAAILAANDGKRVDIVLEMVGGKTFDASLAVLAPFGRLVTFGSASRVAATPVAPTALLAGTKTVAGFWLGNCFGNPVLVNDVIIELFKLIKAGKLRPVVGPIFPLSQATEALRQVLARKTTGKVTLNPDL